VRAARAGSASSHDPRLRFIEEPPLKVMLLLGRRDGRRHPPSGGAGKKTILPV